MIALDVYNIDNKKVDQFEVKESVFNTDVKEHLFYDVVRYQLAKKRKGNASTKNRAEVTGSGIKPWRQKGTGRARAGSRKSPLWVGGGTVFGPTPRAYEHKLNKKVLKTALCSAISMRKRDGNLLILEEFTLEEPKTQVIKKIFDKLGITEKCLLVVNDQEHAGIKLAARNLAKVKVIDSTGLNVYDILLHNKLIFLISAAKKVEERLDRG